MRSMVFTTLFVLPATAFTRPVVRVLGALATRNFGLATSAIRSTTASTCSPEATQKFIDSVNSEYEELHQAFELQFWGTKMALAGSYSVSELTRTKREMEDFLADETKLARTRELLASVQEVSEDDNHTAKTLRIFERTFGCYIMESEEAKLLRSEALDIEGKLENERNNLVLGAIMPDDGNFLEMSSVGLRSKLRVDPDESVRQACYEGLTKIGDFVTDNGFVELVKTRNRMAKSLGYQDYYDYKVTQAEGR